MGVSVEDDRFAAAVQEGTSLSDSSLKNALYVVGEPRSLRDDARAFADAMRELDYEQLPLITQEQAAAIVAGTHSGTWIDGHIGPNFLVASAQYNEPLERFIGAFKLHGAEKALAYLKGVGAVCALAAQSMVVAEGGTLLPYLRQRTQPGPAASRTTVCVESVPMLNDRPIPSPSQVVRSIAACPGFMSFMPATTGDCRSQMASRPSAQ